MFVLSDELCRSCACLFNDTSIYIISFETATRIFQHQLVSFLCCVGSYRIYFYRSISFQFIERVTGVVTDTSPVVFVHFCGGCFCQLVSCLEVIPADMILSQYPFDRCKISIRRADVDSHHTVGHFGIRSGSGFVVVVHNVNTHCCAAITSVTAPVINNIITHISTFLTLIFYSGTETWCATVMVCHQIMMIGSVDSSPNTAISMRAFGMSR